MIRIVTIILVASAMNTLFKTIIAMPVALSLFIEVVVTVVLRGCL